MRFNYAKSATSKSSRTLPFFRAKEKACLLNRDQQVKQLLKMKISTLPILITNIKMKCQILQNFKQEIKCSYENLQYIDNGRNGRYTDGHKQTIMLHMSHDRRRTQPKTERNMDRANANKRENKLNITIYLGNIEFARNESSKLI